jgi:hypothetical protein
MTYWPISSPSVFAATKHTNPERTRVSNDGVKDSGPDEDSHSQVEDATAQGDAVVKEKEGALNQSIEDDIYGEIIAIRVTRSGHMFATLTRTTLTIWQTKACLSLPRNRPVADTLCSLLLY